MARTCRPAAARTVSSLHPAMIPSAVTRGLRSNRPKRISSSSLPWANRRRQLVPNCTIRPRSTAPLCQGDDPQTDPESCSCRTPVVERATTGITRRSRLGIPHGARESICRTSTTNQRLVHTLVLSQGRLVERSLLRLRAGGDDRAVGGGAGAAGCGPLGRKGGRDSGGPAIGDEEHFVIAALRRAVGGVAVRAHDVQGAGGAGRSGRPARSGIAL